MNSIMPAAIAAILIVASSSLMAANDGARRMIGLEHQVLEFTASRPDFSVGIVWVSVFSPDDDWRVDLPKAEQVNFQDAGPYKYLELKQIGQNRFALPALTIEPRKTNSGPVCISVKAWFNEVPSEYESFYWVELADRYALLTFCTSYDARAYARHSQNRVATLREFKARLKKPIPLKVRRDLVPRRPAIFVDPQGTVYFHSHLVGRHTEGALSHHLLEAWKLSPDRRLTAIPIAEPLRRPTWPDRLRDLAKEPYEALIRISATNAVARDAAGNLYAPSETCQNDNSARLTQVVRIDAQGACHALAGSTDGHKDGTARHAQFHNITALTMGPGGNLYVADGNLDAGSWIRRVTPDGTVTTLAGSDKVGFADGKGDAARFHLPSGLAADDDGNVYVADPVNARVRKVTPEGVVTTVSGKPGDPKRPEVFMQPSGVAVGPHGDLYILDGGARMARVRRISPDGNVETLVTLDADSRRRANRSRR